MLKKTFLAALLLALPAQALACPSLARLDDENDSCEDNGKYVDAGAACFLDFEGMVKKDAGEAFVKMSQSNKKHVGGAKNSQASGMAGATADLKISEATLDLLIAAGKIAMKNLDGYSRNIYFPEEWDAPEELIGKGIDYLNSSPCYAEPRDILKDMNERTAKYVRDLEAAKKAVVAMKNITTTRDQNLDSAHVVRKPAATNGKGETRVPAKKASGKNSSITGVEQDKAKRRLAPKN